MKYNDAWFGMLSQSALSGLSEYYRKSEVLLETDKKNDLSKKRKEVTKLGIDHNLTEDEEWSEYSLLLDENEIAYDMFFTNYFRYSFIVLAELFLEDHLNKLCWALYRTKKYSKSPEKCDAINDYKNYISHFHLSYDESVWDFIPDLKCIRNCIVHASGDISRRNAKQQSELEQIIMKKIGIKKGYQLIRKYMALYYDDDAIFIEKHYCENLTNNITMLFRTLNKASNFPTKISFGSKK